MKKKTIRLLIAAFSAYGLSSTALADGYRESEQSQMSQFDLDRSTVEDIQWALSSRGYDVSVDGIIGPKTRAALEKFQRDEGIASTGRVDQSTLNALNVDVSEIERMPAAVPEEETESSDY